MSSAFHSFHLFPSGSAASQQPDGQRAHSELIAIQSTAFTDCLPSRWYDAGEAPGDTTTHGLIRIGQVVAQQPDGILFFFGTNDARTQGPRPTKTLVDHQETARNLRELHGRVAHETKARCLWITPPAVNEERVESHGGLSRFGVRFRNEDVARVAAAVRDIGAPTCFDSRHAARARAADGRRAPLHARWSVYKNTGGTTLTTHGAASFDTWGRGFFSLDDGTPYQTAFGNQGRAHNFSFTGEIHTEFIYKGAEYFTFRGDDDVWVFINQKRVINLGGIHGPEPASVNIDDLGLLVGSTYPFDFFFAERHRGGSNVLFQTTLALRGRIR